MQSDKSALRKRLLAERRAESPEERRAVGDEIFQRLTTLDAYRRARTVFLYCSTEEEVDTLRLLQDALSAGKRVCVPLCTEERGVMEAREITALSQLRPGRFGIPEPPGDALQVLPEQLDFCVAPCLAADEKGYRLGYGGGYYDRFLARVEAETAALCPESRFVSCLPTEAFDRPCGLVITERRVHIAR